MLRLGVFHPVAGVGSILMLAGILLLVGQSLTILNHGRRLRVRINIRTLSWWSIFLSAILVSAGALLIANSPAINFDIKLPPAAAKFDRNASCRRALLRGHGGSHSGP